MAEHVLIGLSDGQGFTGRMLHENISVSDVVPVLIRLIRTYSFEVVADTLLAHEWCYLSPDLASSGVLDSTQAFGFVNEEYRTLVPGFGAVYKESIAPATGTFHGTGEPPTQSLRLDAPQSSELKCVYVLAENARGPALSEYQPSGLLPRASEGFLLGLNRSFNLRPVLCEV